LLRERARTCARGTTPAAPDDESRAVERSTGSS
jgi:hypothetical protein